ncbi:hypothetical protein BDR26DRAFT_871800 [Obelidium mucronatum]|nr:hypothetical protein BDR26DRAFT_871800 [Obelidium mucronatum]
MAAVMFPVILLTCWLYYTTYSHVAALLAKSTLNLCFKPPTCFWFWMIITSIFGVESHYLPLLWT